MKIAKENNIGPGKKRCLGKQKLVKIIILKRYNINDIWL